MRASEIMGKALKLFPPFAVILFSLQTIYCPVLQANPVKKTFQLIRQGNLAEARLLVEKARLKGKADYGMDYVFSQYYISPYQKTIHLDSAYLLCLSAISKYKSETTEGKARYRKLKVEYLRIDSAEIFARKDYLDSLGFAQAEKEPSEAAYFDFIQRFPSSSKAVLARERSAAIAYKKAEDENSYQAFERFLVKYPDAGQASQAKEIREMMIFQNAAKKGRIADWEEFIKNHPNNRYVLKAKEKIYILSTRTHEASGYFSFIQKYPAYPAVSLAWEWIYYLESERLGLNELIQRYPGFPEANFVNRERLKGVQLIPFSERGKFGWMDVKGRPIIRARFDSIAEDARCEVASLRFLKAFHKGKVSVFCQDSFPSTELDFDDAEWFQPGLIKVWRSGKQGLFHLGGYPVLEPIYDDISALTSKLLVVKQDGRQLLFTNKGNAVPYHVADEITPAGSYLAFQSGKKFALVKEAEVLQNIENEPVHPEYRYREMERFDANRLVLYEDEAAHFITSGNTTMLRAGKGVKVRPCDWGVLLEESGIVSIVDSAGNRLSGDFESIQAEGNAAIVRKKGLFGLINRRGGQIFPVQYDSLQPFFSGIFQGWKKGRRSILFESGKEVAYSGTFSPDLLRPGGQTTAAWYVLLTDSMGMKAVYNRSGRQIIPFSYSQIYMPDKHWFSLEKDKKFGLADTSGKILLKPEYSGISPITAEFVCLSKGKTFSVYNLSTQKTLLSNLSGVARRLGTARNLFVVRMQDKAGIIDQQGKQVVPCQYDDVLFWSQSKCMVKKAGFWYGFILGTGKELVKPIKKITLVSDRDNEQIYEIESEGKVGIESTLRGELAATQYDRIVPFDLPSGICFFLGSRVQQSSVFNLVYIDSHGTPFKTQYLTEEEYEGILCE